MIYEHTKLHFICLSCLLSLKRAYRRGQVETCSQCSAMMLCSGKRFKAPPRQNEREWKKVEWMVANGWNGYNWPVYPEMTLLEVQAALRQWREIIERTRQQAQEKQSFVEVKRRAMRRRKPTPEQARRELKRQQVYQERILEEVTKLQTKDHTP